MGDETQLSGESSDVSEEMIQQLKDTIPAAFSEDQLDCEKLKELLGQAQVADSEDKYNFTWAGRQKAFDLIREPTTKTLKPQPDKSVDFDDTENLFIEGDNLEVLKILRKAYYEKVKMIYIDPPYNTGKDFVYSDNYHEGKGDYEKRTGQRDEEGKLVSNPESNGRYHSDWLTMMYPRLFLARNMLREDGLIFVSIDDNEVHNLRMIMNDVFGEENFIANVVWEKKYTRSNDARWFSDNHDHVLVFARSKKEGVLNLLPRSEEQKSAYSNPDNHPKGPWKSTPLHAKSGNETSFEYTFENGVTWSPPSGTYPRYSKETLKELEENDEIWFGKDGSATPSRKSFLSDVKDGVTPVTIWPYDECGSTHNANSELKELLGDNVFDNPKPTLLIQRMLELATYSDDGHIVLDFFAGSGTTAHAVMKQNKKDQGNRKSISVQLPEKTDDDSEARRKGYDNIAEISRDRIRSTIEHLGDDQDEKGKEYGFKALRLSESNFTAWSPPEDEEELQEQLQLHESSLRSDASKNDVVYELLLKDGFTPNAELEEIDAGGKTVHKVVEDDVVAFICVEDELDDDTFDDLDLSDETTVICLDSALTDTLKDNLSRRCDLKTV